MPVGYYIAPTDMAPFQAPPNATRPMAIGDAYVPPSIPPPDPPDDIVTVPAYPFSDSTLGGLVVTFGAFGNGFYYPSMDRSLASFPSGFELISALGGAYTQTSRGTVIRTGATAGSSAFLETTIDYDYGADYANYDVTVDVLPVSPPSLNGLTSVVDLARLQGQAADGSRAFVRVVRDPSFATPTNAILIEGQSTNGGGAVTASGVVTLPDFGPGVWIRLRLVRNNEYVFGLAGIVDPATNEVESYTKVFDYSLFASTTGPISFGVDNRSAAVRVSSKFANFEFRPCAMVVPAPGLGGRAALLDGVFLPTRWRLVGTIPAALYSLRDLGVHDVDVFGVWGRSRLVGALEYVLPDALVVGKTATKTLQTPTDQNIV